MKNTKGLFSAILTICLLTLIIFGNTAMAADYSDITGHWAQNAIESWSDREIIKGYDGLFRPDDSIKRGEMAVILDRVLKLEEGAENIFSDLEENFYTDAVLKVNKAGIMLGSGDFIRPADAITLQETVVMLCRAFCLTESENTATGFIDDENIAEWARGSVCAMVQADYLHGSDGYLKPKANISRAQVITLLENIYKSGLETLTEKIDGPKETPTPTPETEAAPEPNQTPMASASTASGETSSGGTTSGGQSTQASTATPEPTPNTNGITIETTLHDGEVQFSNKKTVDVWAKDKYQQKIPAEVTLNDEIVLINWDDETKTSYTLEFTKEGENIVEITASDDEGGVKTVVYTLVYEYSKSGTVVGTAVWSVEIFSIGGGYLIPPQTVDIIEGENTAQALDRILKNAGFNYRNTGNLDNNFYLSFILDDQSSMNLNPQISQNLADRLSIDMDYYDPDDWTAGCLGEFDFSNGSGWMYAINNVFPNVGFADSYLSHGDVVRVQYTLAYGKDNGGYGSLGNGDDAEMYFEAPNRDAATKLIAEKGLSNCPPKAIDLVTRIDATLSDISNAISLMR